MSLVSLQTDPTCRDLLNLTHRMHHNIDSSYQKVGEIECIWLSSTMWYQIVAELECTNLALPCGGDWSQNNGLPLRCGVKCDKVRMH